ncbi:S-layer homology domain-containing protein [Rossellomorea sp. YZS02]|uniref:S-layer homology domain-containing protein n=1 Tax=Rossellomorea sp. YZS02 TaxID=3097358 RepID=UPI002A0AA9B5|nr:S-layer homology domain-containing protein [Rossellomorea sp. YZS02]MDX8344132.1 S-layer homology domain-containing protein [Rossellomorea sp. YZS02]
MKKGFISLFVALMVLASTNLTAFAASFTDIGGTYAKPYIEALSAKNIISGYNDGTYRPQEKVTRAQFAKMLALALELPANPDSAKGFKDVKDWADPYVGALVDSEITKGIRPDFFGADNPITRQEMIVMFVRAMGMEDYAHLVNLWSEFEDETKISQFAYTHVAFAEQIGFAEGNKNFFMPTQTADRAAAAKWIYNFTIDSDKYFENSLNVIAFNTVTLEHLESVKVIDDTTVQLQNFDGSTENRELAPFMDELMVRLNYEYLYFLDGYFWNDSNSSVKDSIVQTTVSFWESEYSSYTLKVTSADAKSQLKAYLNTFYSNERNIQISILEDMESFAQKKGIIVQK